MPSYVITGANRGLGYAFVKHLAASKDNTVIGLVRNASSSESRAQADGLKNVHFIEAHVTEFASMTKAADQVSHITGGSVDVLINNAAYMNQDYQFLPITGFEPSRLEAELNESFKVNLVGVAHTINAFLPLIRKGSLKKVGVISTGMADIDFVNRFDIAMSTPYAISKIAVNMLIAKYHVAVGKPEGITFLAISPGVVATSEQEPTAEEMEAFGGMVKAFQAYAPNFHGPLSPEESVNMVVSVIHKATVESNGGEMVSHFGNKQWL